MIPIDFLTMATSFMLNPNFTLNPLTNQYSIIKGSLIKPFAKSLNFPWLITNPRLTLKCSLTSQNLNKPVPKLFKKENKRNPYEVFAKAVLESLKTLQETYNVALVLFIVVASMSFSQNSALAAAGGRMGERSFSSKTSSTPKNSPSRSSSYKNSPSKSSSYKNSPSKSSSYKTRSSRGSSSSILYSLSHSLRSMYRYHGSSYNGSKTLVESIRVGTGTPQKIGPWSGTQIIVAALCVLCILRVIFCYASHNSSSLSERISVLKLQGSTQSLQKELNKIAETADRSTKEGLKFILTETTRVMLQHIDYCISGYSSASTEMKDGEKTLSSLSSEESSKFYKEKLENLLNVLNREKPSLSNKESTGFNNEYIVVTILVLADKEYKLPRVSSTKDLKEALKMLGSITTDQTLSVEIYWAPQEENGTLTEKDLLRNYPLLRLCKKHNLCTH